MIVEETIDQALSRPAKRLLRAVFELAIAPRFCFEHDFQLADHVQIKSASLENGLLQVDLYAGRARSDEAPSDTHNGRQECRP